MYLEKFKEFKYKVEKVEVDGVVFYLREITGDYFVKFKDEKDSFMQTCRMIHASLCDENGNLTENPADFNEFIKVVPNKTMIALAEEFTKLNSFEKKEAELKNS
jgi:hypothetical protein